MVLNSCFAHHTSTFTCISEFSATARERRDVVGLGNISEAIATKSCDSARSGTTSTTIVPATVVVIRTVRHKYSSSKPQLGSSGLIDNRSDCPAATRKTECNRRLLVNLTRRRTNTYKTIGLFVPHFFYRNCEAPPPRFNRHIERTGRITRRRDWSAEGIEGERGIRDRRIPAVKDKTGDATRRLGRGLSVSEQLSIGDGADGVGERSRSHADTAIAMRRTIRIGLLRLRTSAMMSQPSTFLSNQLFKALMIRHIEHQRPSKRTNGRAVLQTITSRLLSGRCPFLALSLHQRAANGGKRRHKAKVQIRAIRRVMAGHPATPSTRAQSAANVSFSAC